MALTATILRSTAGLAALSDEQIGIIEELSRNDENTVIGTRIGELHGQYDSDVLSVTGIAKKQGEKSYDYVKRVLGDYKTRAQGADALNSRITDLETQIEGYKKTIADGKGNEALAQQLKDAQRQLSDTQALFEAKDREWKEKYNRLDTQYRDSLIDAEFDKALQGMKFKSVYPESVQKVLADSAKQAVLKDAKPEWVEDGTSKKLVFRDGTGNIMTNKDNLLKPYTAGELLRQQLNDVLDTGRQQAGTGTKPGGGAGGAMGPDLSGVKTQVGADEAIAKYLMSLGYTRGSRKFADESVRLRKEYGVEKLPTQ